MTLPAEGRGELSVIASPSGTARFLGAFLDDPIQTPPVGIAAMARQFGEAVPPCLNIYRDGR